MKESWFSISRGGRDPYSHLPRVFIARAQTFNPEALKKAKLKYDSRIGEAADIHFNTLKPIRNKYEQESDLICKGWALNESLLLRYFSEMEELEKKLDTTYLREVKRARSDYKTSILTILGHHYLGIPTFLFDLHSMRPRGIKQMNKGEFFKIITQQDQWAVCDLIYILGVTEDELANTILEYKNELEVHVEGESTLAGALLSKTISFEILNTYKHRNDLK